ncbi:unnamed protein product [Candidula unifasciata]|uniref:UDENN domain-containing protein n=1 Tax=Candidula unifasciata TaxID=100452 RepID=A0A8S3YPV4_9EUPU|nr:unnamed protein product [Candidula unifasciata]
MGSRLREKVEHLFEVFVEVAKPNGIDEAPFIIQQYPPDYDDKEVLSNIPKFAYPCPTDASKVDHFTFVLTDLDSMFRFGYSRHATGHQTCLCIVSWLPWFEIFYKMLDFLAEIMNRSEKNNITHFLQVAYNHEIPLPRISVTIVANEEMFNFTTPDPNVLPSIPQNRNLTEYYSAVDPYNMMVIFASMLHERRIYMTSKKLSRLTACIHAAEALLYPMHWQHLFIPVLPSHLIDYVSAPMPFLIGVHSNLIEKLKQHRVDIGDAVIVDLDANTVTTEYDDLGDLPEDVSSYLKRSLKTDFMMKGDAISLAFLHALVRLIGGYRDALKFRPGEPITFDPEAFVRSRPSQSTQAFLEGMLTLQIFQQFIYGRLEILNSGAGFRDIFEVQATLYTDKLNSQSKYKEWLKSVKKSGKKGWNGLKIKAAPVMSTAVQSMKEQGKRAMADFKTRISGLTESEDKKGSSQQIPAGVVYKNKKSAKQRPHTTHADQMRSARPPRPPPPSRVTQLEYERRNKSVLQDHDSHDVHLNYQRVDMSLMNDTDIQAAMQTSAGHPKISNQAQELNSSDEESESESSDSEEARISFGVMHSSDEDTQKAAVPRPVAAPRTKLPAAHTRGISPSPTVENSTSKNALPQSSIKKTMSENAISSVSLPDAPLIKFDSSESDPTDSDNFDPLAKSPHMRSDTDVGAMSISNDSLEDNDETDIRPLQRSVSSRVSLTRSKAFRREAPPTPIRTHYLDDTDDIDGLRKNDPSDIFDPLSDLNNLTVSGQACGASSKGNVTRPVLNDPLSSRHSSDLLMHEWSLASLAKGPSIRMPMSAKPLGRSYAYNSFLGGASQSTPAVQQSLPASSFSSPALDRNLRNQNSRGPQQIPNLGYSLDRNTTDFSKVLQPQPQQQPILSRSSNSSPSHNKVVNFPSTSQQSSPSPRTPATSSFIPPTPSSSVPYIHGSIKHSQHFRSGGVNSSLSSSSSSGSSLQTQKDYFSDLQNIDFGGVKPPDRPTQQRKPANSRVSHPHQKWETFD